MRQRLGRDLDAEIRSEGAAIWGISPDDAASHRAFRERHDLPFTLLSDEDHAVAEAYGAWVLKTSYGRESMGIQRSSFLVDPAGRIARTWPRVTADGHAAEVLAAVASLELQNLQLELLRAQVKRRGAAGLLVTHSQAAAAGCDRRYRLSAAGLEPII